MRIFLLANDLIFLIFRDYVYGEKTNTFDSIVQDDLVEFIAEKKEFGAKIHDIKVSTVFFCLLCFH